MKNKWEHFIYHCLFVCSFFSEFTETYLLACLVDYFDNNPDFKRSVMLDLDMREHNMGLKNRAPLCVVTRTVCCAEWLEHVIFKPTERICMRECTHTRLSTEFVCLFNMFEKTVLIWVSWKVINSFLLLWANTFSSYMTQ